LRRRDFIAFLGGSAAAWPFAAGAQQPMPVIGFLGSDSPDEYTDRLRAFHEGLGETGFIDGKNVAIEYRWAEGQYDRLPKLAAELVRQQVNVIAVSGSTPAALAAKAATVTIPIVFQIGSDPVAIGLVTSLNKPGGNLTGIASLNVEMGAKRLQLLHELVPNAPAAGLLVNPDNPILTDTVSKDFLAEARTLGVQANIVRASTEREIEDAFAALTRLGVGAVVISTDAYFNNRSDQLAALTQRYKMPAVAQFRRFAAAGGLMSYGGSYTELPRQVGIYTGRVLKGEKPAELPVQQVTKVELVINLRSAKALGINVPLSLLGRADEVIE
jgi:putative tryptophan/tyrosine transport system substrate-binding protein